jgi:hypothetical protein
MQQLGSPLLPGWSIGSVNYDNISKIKLLNMNIFCDLPIVISQLACLFNMANAALSMVVLVDSKSSDSATPYNIAICAFANHCFPMELVPCSDGWQRT